MKKITLGILAHVDSGKTTLSESLLYNSGVISGIGRVDHGNAFLDTDAIERERGITIFSKQAVIPLDNTQITLVDTPGHVDFSAEAERSLCVLDYAVLVISGSDGVQSHSRTLWKLLEHYKIPTFVFVNKMDLPCEGKESLLESMKESLSDFCVDFEDRSDEMFETVALSDSALMDEYLENGSIADSSLTDAIAARKIFPCFFGSALKNEGVRELLEGIDRYTSTPMYGNEFGAKVYKISEDSKGTRLTHLKITGGSLKVKTLLNSGSWSQKVNEIRIYSGDKYRAVQEAYAGDVCALTGLDETYPGEGLGTAADEDALLCEPVFTYSVKLPGGMDVIEALPIFKKLESEETQMKVSVGGTPRKINIQIMGEIQLEVIKRIVSERFKLDVEFEHGSILYKETVRSSVEGVGHYEPLRHYAEVHLLIEPGEPGSGVTIGSKCSEDDLARNWQRLILTHLEEKPHIGVLTGSPVTDIKITLISGRAHVKHTEGGDFRQATYRAVRQGLMQADNVLLEPYYSFTLDVPTESTGKALTDLQQMGASFEAPVPDGDITRICGKAAVSAIRDYHKSVVSYTHGKGRLSCIFAGYEPCVNQEEIIEAINYDCEGDLDNTPDSVFCAKGSGFTVKWDEVFDHMHIPLAAKKTDEVLEVITVKKEKITATDAELERIFEQTYGKQEKKPGKKRETERTAKPYKGKSINTGPEYLLIDGYNIIYAWDELRKISQDNPDAARSVLINRLCNYAAMKKNNVILVFDAYKVKGNQREIEQINNISVVYTKEAETADTYIEKTSKELSRNYRVRVATSDSQEQMIVFGNGAVRVAANDFQKEVELAEAEMRRLI